MIKPFISFRDNLSSAGWSNLEENKCKPYLITALQFFFPLRKQTEKAACGQIFKNKLNFSSHTAARCG